MKSAQKIFLFLQKEFYAGGIVHVPPALCLPPAHASANVPAYVERVGKAVTNKLNDIRTVRPVTVNAPVLFLELAI